MPLIRFLEPKITPDLRIIENIISFRKDKDNEKLRINYLKRIEGLLADLKKCSNDNEAKDAAAAHERVLSGELEMMIAACKQYGIPVRAKTINHSEMNGWEIFGKVWEATTKIVELYHLGSLILLKPLLKLVPSINFYNRVLMKKNTFYPLLILESLSPTWTQKIYAKIRRLDEVRLW